MKVVANYHTNPNDITLPRSAFIAVRLPPRFVRMPPTFSSVPQVLLVNLISEEVTKVTLTACVGFLVTVYGRKALNTLWTRRINEDEPPPLLKSKAFTLSIQCRVFDRVQKARLARRVTS